MKTIYEIVGNKAYRQLSDSEKVAIQDRQTELVKAWQDTDSEIVKTEIFDELFDSLKGLVKSMAYRQAEKSFSVEQEDFEGLMYLVLVESLIDFDRTKEVPFQPVFIMNVRNEIKMMYRQKGYDLHDTTDRLDRPFREGIDATFGDFIENPVNDVQVTEANILTEELLEGCFGDNEKKKTVIHMHLQDFKRNEIVRAIGTVGKTVTSVEKYVNRTVKEFKSYCLNLS